ncbi:hypothetical protein C2E20_4561 [Micractinium conductrix]|uniref:Uncharacterized protein n=1 Tax=Micractinium conductrix TaxID=554055 RepID=A0A2P6VDX0_9CHLO|nr:hypothetical protein C2E20_4561 [Micractinium conductrix]|eukprot:PSC72294.1 hypothetical protein C2E20_4561 [Micractinium conductrix]
MAAALAHASLALPARRPFTSVTGRSQGSARRHLVVRAEQSAAAPAASVPTLYTELDLCLDDYRRAPASVKQEVSADVLKAVSALADAGELKKWGAALADMQERRSLMMGELRMVGVKQPEKIAQISVRNDAAFLITVVGTTSVAAVLLGQLPGDWGFFSAYLCGGISIAVLAVGSINPGILQFAIDTFSQVFPDYKDRVVRHEAAHFLCGYLLGVPVANYSLTLGKEHTDFAEAKLQKRLIAGVLEASEVDQLSIIAMAGATSEAMKFDDVIGQNADMFDLQRVMMRSSKKMTNQQQQNQTRWACYQAATLLRRYSAEYEALQAAMAAGGSVTECIKAIEGAKSS